MLTEEVVTTVILENQEKALKEDVHFLVKLHLLTQQVQLLRIGDPILISLVRRSMPNLIAYDICGVQPMTGPTGLIFAMKSRFASQSGTEALFNEDDTDFSSRSNATGSSGSGFPTSTIHSGTNPAVLNDSSPGKYNTGKGMTTAYGEALGDANGNAFAEDKPSQLRKLL